MLSWNDNKNSSLEIIAGFKGRFCFSKSVESNQIEINYPSIL